MKFKEIMKADVGEVLTKCWDYLTTEKISLPRGYSDNKNGIPIQSFYLAGCGAWGFGYTDALYAKAQDIGLKHDVVIFTPNYHGFLRPKGRKVVALDENDDRVDMKVSALSTRNFKQALDKLGVPKKLESLF